ncbi:hypothetical protein MRX96_018917 [Rhipicephalus microplus]
MDGSRSVSRTATFFSIRRHLNVRRKAEKKSSGLRGRVLRGPRGKVKVLRGHAGPVWRLTLRSTPARQRAPPAAESGEGSTARWLQCSRFHGESRYRKR